VQHKRGGGLDRGCVRANLRQRRKVSAPSIHRSSLERRPALDRQRRRKPCRRTLGRCTGPLFFFFSRAEATAGRGCWRQLPPTEGFRSRRHRKGFLRPAAPVSGGGAGGCWPSCTGLRPGRLPMVDELWGLGKTNPSWLAFPCSTSSHERGKKKKKKTERPVLLGGPHLRVSPNWKRLEGPTGFHTRKLTVLEATYGRRAARPTAGGAPGQGATSRRSIFLGCFHQLRPLPCKTRQRSGSFAWPSIGLAGGTG